MGDEEEAAVARAALDSARGLLSQGRAVEALKVVLELSRRLRRDDAPVRAALASASAAAADAAAPPPPPRSFGPADLALLLEQVSLAPSGPSAPPPPPPPPPLPADGTDGAPSLLAAQGRGAIADDALADGSSVRCGRCGGVIAARRIWQHAAWCSAAEAPGDDDMEH